jgi:hypothetical protein
MRRGGGRRLARLIADLRNGINQQTPRPLTRLSDLLQPAPPNGSAFLGRAPAPDSFGLIGLESPTEALVGHRAGCTYGLGLGDS